MDWYETVATAIRSREAVGVATVVAGPRALGAKCWSSLMAGGRATLA